MEKKQVLMQK